MNNQDREFLTTVATTYFNSLNVVNDYDIRSTLVCQLEYILGNNILLSPSIDEIIKNITVEISIPLRKSNIEHCYLHAFDVYLRRMYYSNSSNDIKILTSTSLVSLPAFEFSVGGYNPGESFYEFFLNNKRDFGLIPGTRTFICSLNFGSKSVLSFAELVY